MIIPFYKLLLLFSLFLLPVIAEDWQDTQESSPLLAPSVTPTPRNYPRIILMPLNALLFEEGSAIEISMLEAREILQVAYLFIEEYFEQANNLGALEIIRNTMASSTAQIFARQNQDSRYLLINVFPTRSLHNQMLLRRELWRPTSSHSPDFWRIRYNLDTQEFCAFNHDQLS